MTELRYRHPYIGRPRYDEGEPLHQRWFDAPPGAIMWTMADQAAAIDRGYFVARHVTGLPSNHASDNHAVILPMAPRDGYPTDADITASAEALAFRRDPHAMKLIAFVEQQDRHGYNSAWDRTVQYLTKTLTWYKGWKAGERGALRVLSEKGRKAARIRWGT